VTTCPENREMSGNFAAVREMLRILVKIRQMSGKKSCHGRLTKNSSKIVCVILCAHYFMLFIPGFVIVEGSMPETSKA